MAAGGGAGGGGRDVVVAGATGVAGGRRVGAGVGGAGVVLAIEVRSFRFRQRQEFGIRWEVLRRRDRVIYLQRHRGSMVSRTTWRHSSWSLIGLSLFLALLVLPQPPAQADFSLGHAHYSELPQQRTGWKYSYFTDPGYRGTYYTTDTELRYQTSSRTMKLFQTRIKFGTNPGQWRGVGHWNWRRSDGEIVASGYGFTSKVGDGRQHICVQTGGRCGEVSVTLNRTWSAFLFTAAVAERDGSWRNEYVQVRLYQ